MELEQLRMFIKVAKTGSFTKAAEELFVSHSTVSRAVSSLEAELGKKLLERDNRVLGLTPEGAFLLKRAEDALTLIDEIAGEIHNM